MTPAKLASALLVVAACTAHDPAIDHKLDTLATQIAQLRQDVEQPKPPPPQAPSADRTLERKIDDIEHELDKLAEVAAASRTPPPPRRPEPDRSKTYAITVDGFPSEGPLDARVAMVFVTDYASPYAEKMRDIRDDLLKKYGKDLRVVYRNLVVHPQIVMSTALGACAANKQHQFRAYDDIAWDDGFKGRQFDKDDATTQPPKKCWESTDGCPVAVGFATKAKLDVAKFKRDMVACVPELQADMADLQKFGVGAVPEFFVNGRFLAGAVPIETFSALIDDELAKANDRIAKGARASSYYKDWVVAKGLKQLEP